MKSIVGLKEELKEEAGLAVRAAVIVGAGVLFGFGLNAVRRDPVSFATFEPKVSCSVGGTDSSVTELSIAAASALCGKSGVVFADARPSAAFASGHVAEAVHLPCNRDDATSTLRDFEGARHIVVYADTTESARPVAEELRRRNPRVPVSVLQDGFSAWEREGLSCAAGPCPECTAVHR